MPVFAPDPLDRRIAANIRRERLRRGLSQEALAARLGIAYQQVQKYERGENRIAASRLFRIAEILQVPIDVFVA